MIAFVSSSLLMFYLLLGHTFRMMYWAFYPGVLLSGLVSLRYHKLLREKVAGIPDQGLKTIALAALLGLTSSAGRKRSLMGGLELFAQGLSPGGVVAYLIASHNLVIYAITLTMVLLGIEFAVGQLIGAIIMIALMSLVTRLAIPYDLWGPRRSVACAYLDKAFNNPATVVVPLNLDSWRGLTVLASWWNLLRYLLGELHAVWITLVISYLIGGFILAGGLQSWWIDLANVGGGGFLSDVINVLIAPFISIVAFASPVGNLPIGSNLFKSYTLNYPGLVTFVLASLLNPKSMHIYLQVFGRKVGWRLIVSMFLCAILSGLLVTGVYGVFGFRPGHVPLFRELVDKIIMWLPFTMPPMEMSGGSN